MSRRATSAGFEIEMSNIFEKLIAAFIRFPGIGPRQARRFVYHLLAQSPTTVAALAKDLSELKRQIKQCQSCYCYFSKAAQSENGLCDLCLDPKRDSSVLMIVEKDADLEIVRKSEHYPGRFFVLGGLLPILEPQPEQKIRVRPLLQRINEAKNELKEIIIALAANPEGDNTCEYLQKILTPYAAGTKVTVLGRGLSTGTELEYSDEETLKNALKNRA